MEDKYQIFISYARADYCDQDKRVIPGNIISEIKQLLSDNNIDYWWDEKILGGHEYTKDIITAIDCSHIYLVVLTENSVSSDFVELEILRARKKKKKIIPVLTIPADRVPDHIDFLISHLEYIDYTKSKDDANKKLIQSIEGLLQDQSLQKELEAYKEKIGNYDETLERFQSYREKLNADLEDLREKLQSITLEIKMREESIELIDEKEQNINKDKKELQTLIDELTQKIMRVQSQKVEVPLDSDNRQIDTSAQIEDGETIKADTKKDIDIEQEEHPEKSAEISTPLYPEQQSSNDEKADCAKNGFISLMAYYNKPKSDS